ncbi:hypothetical protein PHYPSEUDO_014883 [Phytophthora pseudosyringae]|uniref:BED-type domain-containing protein n=1 Tax=Phytophthora pseudosyringae TaxID=221518 RepID=A0A8T1W031_9STRA|nr:hypothetical protein PHYPSEUDO_014883 [Phytophthora pseudosyringae]
MTRSADACAFFFEPVYDSDGPPPPPASPLPPPSPSAPKKRGRKKRASLGGANRHRCKVCRNVYTQAASTGYTNLLTHLRIKHPEWEEMFKLQRLETAAAPVASSSDDRVTESSFRFRSSSTTTSSATSSASRQKQTAGRKRGPIYEHFEDAPSSPGNKQKRMRCVYCHEDTPQISGRLKLHLSTKCRQVPEDVKTKYEGAVRLMSNKLERVVANKDEAEAKVDTAAKSEPVATFTPPPAATALKTQTAKLQQSPKVKTSPSTPASMQNKRVAGNLHVFDEKLTAALIATNAPWALLDNADFREAMEILHPASDNFPLSAAHARTEVLDRLAQKYDRDCRDVLSASNGVTLSIKNTDVGADGAKKTTYVAVNEWRRAFVLAKGSGDASVSPDVAEVLSVLSTLPTRSSSVKIFLCAPTSGAYSRARQELQRSASAPHKPVTLMGSCMTQQTALLLHELVLCSMSLEEALDNAVLAADALDATPSLRQCVLRSVYSDTDKVGEDANTFAQVSVTSWRSVAMAVKQATRLEPFLRLAISQESQASTPSSASLRPLIDMSGSDMAWNTLRHTAQLLAPLNFISALSELQTTTSGQLLALWIWLFGAATRSPLLDGNSDELAANFMQRLGCYVEEHFLACLVLDPRVHGAGLSVSGLRRARSITIRVATSLVPGFNENNFIRSYNEYMKKQGDFGESGVWSAANTSSAMEFWGDYEGDPVHDQLAKVAKTVCSFVPHTCSVEDLWAAHAQRANAVHTKVSKEHEKCTKIRHRAAFNARVGAKDVVSRFQTLLAVENEPSVAEMLQSNAAVQASHEQTGSTGNLSVGSVLGSVQDGLEDDVAACDAPSSPLDVSWFDISSTGLDKIRSTMENYLSAAIQQ